MGAPYLNYFKSLSNVIFISVEKIHKMKVETCKKKKELCYIIFLTEQSTSVFGQNHLSSNSAVLACQKNHTNWGLQLFLTVCLLHSFSNRDQNFIKVVFTITKGCVNWWRNCSIFSMIPKIHVAVVDVQEPLEKLLVSSGQM